MKLAFTDAAWEDDAEQTLAAGREGTRYWRLIQ
jgi:hypothetical protein